MKMWKRNAVVVAIVLFVGAAVYLNWSYNNQSAGHQDKEDGGSKVLGQSTLVSGDADGDVSDTQASSTDNSGASGTGYFATARLNRQQARDNALELLQQAAADEKADQTMVDEANSSIQAMAAFTMSEAQVENLVTAKGYKECVAFMGDDGISVVVSTDSGELTEADVAKITDITVSETGLPVSDVKIMAAN